MGSRVDVLWKAVRWIQPSWKGVHPMTNRSLAALGLDDVAVMKPLSYPGRPVTEPGLLIDGELLALETRRDRLGAWRVVTPPDTSRELDHALARMGQVDTGHRHPVISVGSNASPGQLSHKLTRLGLPVAVPMVPVQIRGIGVGCSGHISPAGYVAGAPYVDPEAESTFIVTWLDPEQLKAVDATEIPDYQRAILPGSQFTMTMPSGERLGGAYIYFSTHGLLAGPDGRPRAGGGDQATLLASLLDDSPRLRDLLGPDPTSWVERAGGSQELRELGTRIFGAEGWVLPHKDYLPFVDDSREPSLYADLPAIAGTLPTRG